MRLAFYQWRLTRQEMARELAQRGFRLNSVKPRHSYRGLLRFLHHNFGRPFEWTLTRGMTDALSFILPSAWFGHMLLADASVEASA